MSTASKGPAAAKRRGRSSRRKRSISIPPRLREAEGKQKLDRHWRSYFLIALVETSNVTRAAQTAGVSLGRAYKVRIEDPDFHRQWLAALAEGYRNLEMEVLGYLRDPAPDRKMDVASAIRVLSLHRQTVAQQRAQEDDLSEAEVLESINQMILDMRDRSQANDALLAMPETPDEGD